ncbi:response regulator [Nibricoccus sp. IMCC34717]|uniref:response regulator n=1 Tax=Nibricoccus sp. IMCC34717 TaxID=3034021 RepID=UPI00384BF9E4
MTPTTIVLAEDHTVVREGLRTLLELCPEFHVVAEAANGRQAVELVAKHRPKVVIMDVAMPLLNGFEATRQIRRAVPATKILVLSAHSDDEYVSHMAAEGVSGYVVKQNSGQVLLHAVRELAAGRKYFSPSIIKRVGKLAGLSQGRGRAAASQRAALTSREAEVLQLVAEGLANKQIAAELGISIKTVEKHRQQLMDKLDIHETAGLTRHAIATGVIESQKKSKSS